MNSVRLTLLIPIALAASLGHAAGQGYEFAAGRALYAEGDFRKAAQQFQLALDADPDNAEASYWTGMSYQRLADVAMPFGSKYNAKARAYLTKAVKLAPAQPYYRQALFDFLLDSADSSRTALRDAAAILRTVSESDPDYSDMRRRFDDERRVNSSANARLGRLFLTVPRAAYSIAALPASTLSGPRVASSLPAGQ